MRKLSLILLLVLGGFLANPVKVLAITPSPSPTATASATPEATPEATARPDITQKTEETLGPLAAALASQKLGPVWPFNPIKYAIRSAVDAGVPANTIVLLLLLPVVASVIAAARHLVGIRGFGIFLPAALAVTFVAIGPVVGIGLFLVIVAISIFVRFSLRRLKIKLQYLPRMALLLWWVAVSVLGILFLAPVINNSSLSNVSIFPVLVLILLAEDFSRVQLGKSAKIAVNLTTETLILALVSFIFLTLKPVHEFALLNPEILLGSIFVFNFLLGKYAGLRLMELWKFRKIISS